MSGSVPPLTHSVCLGVSALPFTVEYPVYFDVILTVHHSIDFFQVTNLMHTSLIL